MGDWGKKAWENDEASDWFHGFWREKDFTILIDEIKKFDATEERYDSLRAAGYLLETLGIPHIWPSEYMEELKPLLLNTISILENMINPPNDDWGFLDMWGNDPDIVEEVQNQIKILKIRSNNLVD